MYQKQTVADILATLDLGSSIAEQDALLETARVETSAFTDLLHDRVDLIPGTKGSGKSALYRIFVEFLAGHLLEDRKVVVAHGVNHHGDLTFAMFQEHFETLSEDDFVSFWCIYLISLAHEQFLRSDRFQPLLKDASSEVRAFEDACKQARIPPMGKKRSLNDVLSWVLNTVTALRPGMKVDPADGSMTFAFWGDGESTAPESSEKLPRYAGRIKDSLEALLMKTNLSLWLMVDRLDEIFPRRSSLETKALRGLLRTLRIFESPRIRVKVFLRDDILKQITSDGKGFTALTHITARGADTLRWTEDQILTMITKRFAAEEDLASLIGIDPERLAASQRYRHEVFYRIFPPTVYRGTRQSPTLRWLYTHVADGNGVVTPRDVIDLLSKAKQKQLDELQNDPDGTTPVIVGSASILYGLSELSKRKRETYLQAEFPHFWDDIAKFVQGKTEYSERAVHELLGSKSDRRIEDLVGIGILKPTRRKGKRAYQIPFLYRAGLELTQGGVD